jgi:tetratricopeptide (TPR) repeat protein
MADVTTTFAAKDESFAKTVDNLNGRLQGFQAETEGFTGKVGQMAKSFADFAIPIAGVAAAFFGAKGAVSAFSDAIRIGGELNDLAARTGETAGELAVLQRAFQNAGMSGGEVGTMLNRLQRFMIEASEGGKTQVEAMEKLGLSYDELKTKSPSEQLQILAQRIAAIDDPAQRSAIAMQIFGRGGGEMMPLLRAMGVELDNARAQLGSYPAAIDRANKALDTIGDNFVAVKNKVVEFVTGALVDIAPTIARASDELARMDFAAMGMKLADALQRAYDFFVGLWQNPARIFDLFASYLDAQLRLAGDTLASAFMTAVNALGNFLRELIERDAFGRLGDVLANAFLFGVTKFNLELMNALEGAAKFWGGLWDLVTGRGSEDFAKKLFDVVQFFATDFGRAMIDPIGFIGNKVASALMGATSEASTDYQYAFDEASGAWVDRHKAGLEAAHAGAGQRLTDSSKEFADTLAQGTAAAAANTELVQVNLFGGKEAVERTNELAAEIAEQGRQFRESMEGAVPPSEEIALNIGTLPDNGQSFEDHLRASAGLSAEIELNLNSAALAAERIPPAFSLAEGSSEKIAFDLNTTADSGEETSEWLEEGSESTAKISIHGRELSQSGQEFAKSIADAKIDAQVTSDLFKGLSDRMNDAVDKTSGMLDKMREAFHFGKVTQEEINEMRRLEEKQRLAENARDRAYERAERMEKNGQERAAHNLRMRADATLTKALEKIRPDLEKATDAARKALEAGADAAEVGLKAGGNSASDSIKGGGAAAASALNEAASALKDALSDSQQTGGLALEATLQACRDFLKQIDEKLPQHALT